MKNKTKTRISRLMSYLLRHNPRDLEMSKDGFVNLYALIEKVKERYDWVDKEYIKKIVKEDEKGRYEIVNDRIRARYGHTIDVSIHLPLAEVSKLYHGTTQQAAKEILAQGLKRMEREKVHLSQSIQDAIKVGKRKTGEPTILVIDVEQAIKEGTKIEKASEKVYVADYIPKKFISNLKKK
ncbi:MAG: RNA 2'-phosphotransferase [Candidatus Aenigmarchaeota archaeon]|nr:RNA 2'-phosphotransferase [Candidatus Aenigmarchaeota archaeon]